jgi:hypothetical protein
MTAAETRSPRSPWIKRAVIGATAALILGGGIGVTANAAYRPGDEVHRVSARGATEQEAEENAKRNCSDNGMEFYDVAGPAQRIPGSELGPGRPDEFEITVVCTKSRGTTGGPGSEGSEQG